MRRPYTKLTKPTVCLDVISLVASSYEYDSGQIEQRVAHELAGHWATHGRLTPKGFTHQAPPSDEGQPCGRTREEQRPHRFRVPRDAMPTQRSSFRLLAMASPR